MTSPYKYKEPRIKPRVLNGVEAGKLYLKKCQDSKALGKLLELFLSNIPRSVEHLDIGRRFAY